MAVHMHLGVAFIVLLFGSQCVSQYYTSLYSTILCHVLFLILYKLVREMSENLNLFAKQVEI